jgi:hypothetical protein
MFVDLQGPQLRECCPHAITDAMMRVDGFRNHDNILRVNEFESLAVDYPAKNQREPDHFQIIVTSDRKSYYSGRTIVTNVLVPLI